MALLIYWIQSVRMLHHKYGIANINITWYCISSFWNIHAQAFLFKYQLELDIQIVQNVWVLKFGGSSSCYELFRLFFRCRVRTNYIDWKYKHLFRFNISTYWCAMIVYVLPVMCSQKMFNFLINVILSEYLNCSGLLETATRFVQTQELTIGMLL